MIKPPTLSPLAFVLALMCIPLLRGERREALRARIEQSRETYRRRSELRKQIGAWTTEARSYEQLMRERLAGLGYMWAARYKYDHGKSAGSRRDRPTTYKVRFERIYTTPEIIYYKLRVREKTLFGSRNALPHTVRVTDLTDDATIKELSFACERTVTAVHHNPRCGAWYLVHRLKGIGLLPERVAWRDLLEHYPADMAVLPWVMGVGARRAVQTIYLSKHPHLLVAGPTGTGKSNAVNGFILGLMYYTHPDDLKLTLIDLKEGVEFEPFVNAAHLYQPIVRKPEDALAALQATSIEIDRRLKLLRETGAKDLPSYNAQVRERLPYLIAIIDEYAQLVLPVDKKVRDEANRLVVRISALGRAAGIQIVVCTQYPTKEVVDPQIKINLNLKMSFRTQNATQSTVILADPRAASLPETLGRALYALGPDVFEVQVGKVTPEDITHVLKVAHGRAQGITSVTGKEIRLIPAGAAHYIVEALGGDLSPNRLQHEFAEFGVTRDQVAHMLDDLPKVDGYGIMDNRLIDLNPATEDDTAEVVAVAPYTELVKAPVVAPKMVEVDDGVEEFVRCMCKYDDPLAVTATKHLYKAYQGFASNTYSIVNPIQFGHRLSDMGFGRTRLGGGVNARRGIALLAPQGTGKTTSPSAPLTPIAQESGETAHV